MGGISSSNPPIISPVPPPAPAGAPVVVEGIPANGQVPAFNAAKGIYDPASGGGGGSGTVTSVASGDAALVVTNPTTTPSIQMATMDVLFGLEKPVASVALNAQKITGLANGAAASDALALGQVLAANVIPVADLVAGTAGQVLGGVGPGYVIPPGTELVYNQVTSTVNIASTTEATGTLLVQCSAFTFDGAAVIFEFYCAGLSASTVSGSAVIVSLFEGATEIGIIAIQQNQTSVGAANLPIVARLRFTPTAGSHTYKVTAFATSLTGTPNMQAGAGGTGAVVPMYARFTKG